MEAVGGRTIVDAVATFHQPVVAEPNSPNVVLIVMDDMGFADVSCFGSEIATPNVDALAERGLRYNSFHVTALCSPTRACLLTGRNHHAVGMGGLAFTPLAFPGYSARIPRSAATLARHLRDSGYRTLALGKWHLTPEYETTAAGPFDRWPLGMGFDQYYGFLGGLTNQWAPDLVSGNEFVDPPCGPTDGYHLTEDLFSEAIRRVQIQVEAAPSSPFFLYVAPGAMHFPHQVPSEWIERYRGAFDDGWDAARTRIFRRQNELGIVPPGTTLTERPPWVQPWGDLHPDERTLFSRQMEVYAGFLSHADHQIGRLVAALTTMGVLDNTLLMFLSDNGASAEGGPTGWTNPAEHGTGRIGDPVDAGADRLARLGGPLSYGHYAWGWAWMGNTPFKLWKRYAWLGGVRSPLIVHWPTGIPAGLRGEVRPQFCHAIDVMPTILEASGVVPNGTVDGVTQQVVDGRSFVSTFTDPDASSARTTQYFEVLGSRSIYHAGWKATTDHIDGQNAAEIALVPGSHSLATDKWSLYRIDADYSESVDVGEEHPEVLRQLTELWWSEAGRNQVLPIIEPRALIGSVREATGESRRTRFVYRPGGGPNSIPPVYRGVRLHADIDVGPAAKGVIWALGDLHAGWVCYVVDSQLTVAISLGRKVTTLGHDVGRLVGRHRVEFGFTPGPEAGTARVGLDVDGDRVDEQLLPASGDDLFVIGVQKLIVGRDRGLPVCDGYQPPFPYTGKIHEVVLAIPEGTLPQMPRAAQEALRRD